MQPEKKEAKRKGLFAHPGGTGGGEGTPLQPSSRSMRRPSVRAWGEAVLDMRNSKSEGNRRGFLFCTPWEGPGPVEQSGRKGGTEAFRPWQSFS